MSAKQEAAKGGNAMKREHRQKRTGLVGIGLLVVGMVVGSLVEEAQASAFSTNNVSMINVRITPNVDRGVEIDSNTVSLNLGTVDANVSTKTVSPATVTIAGNFASSELVMQATVTAETAGNPSWTFDNDPTSGETDVLAAWGLFTAVTITSAPIDTDFQIYNATATTTMGDGTNAEVGDTAGRFEGSWGGSDMDAMAAGTKRHFWIRLRTPSSFTTNVGEQRVRYTMTVAAPN